MELPKDKKDEAKNVVTRVIYDAIEYKYGDNHKRPPEFWGPEEAEYYNELFSIESEIHKKLNIVFDE